MKIYLASSWRNAQYPSVLEQLRAAGFDVYDFRHPVRGDYGFSWSEIDPDWQKWDVDGYRRGLAHPAAERGSKFDMDALKDCDTCVLLLPCGRSAHLELGYAVGAGKKTYVLQLGPQEPELMVKMCTDIAASVPELLTMLRAL